MNAPWKETMRNIYLGRRASMSSASMASRSSGWRQEKAAPGVSGWSCSLGTAAVIPRGGYSRAVPRWPSNPGVGWNYSPGKPTLVPSRSIIAACGPRKCPRRHRWFGFPEHGAVPGLEKGWTTPVSMQWLVAKEMNTIPCSSYGVGALGFAAQWAGGIEPPGCPCGRCKAPAGRRPGRPPQAQSERHQKSRLGFAGWDPHRRWRSATCHLWE